MSLWGKLKAWITGWPPRQTCFVYCPGCRLELCASNSRCEDEVLVKYWCERCAMESEWDFDMPAPIVLRWRRGEFSEWTMR